MNKEKVKELQDKLKFVNRKGSMMDITTSSGLKLSDMVDSFNVIDVREDFTIILWRDVGYDQSANAIHTTNFKSVTVDEFVTDKHDGEQWVVFDMIDDFDRPYHVEMILAITDQDAAESWQQWQRWKNSKADFFHTIDTEMVKRAIANNTREGE